MNNVDISLPEEDVRLIAETANLRSWDPSRLEVACMRWVDANPPPVPPPSAPEPGVWVNRRYPGETVTVVDTRLGDPFGNNEDRWCVWYKNGGFDLLRDWHTVYEKDVELIEQRPPGTDREAQAIGLIREWCSWDEDSVGHHVVITVHGDMFTVEAHVDESVPTLDGENDEGAQTGVTTVHTGISSDFASAVHRALPVYD